MRKRFDFVSCNEVTLDAYVWYAENCTPQGILVLSHGMAESILRYDQFAEFLIQHGIFVYGHSHRGHGEHAAKSNRLGDIGEDGWNRMVDDLNTMVNMAKEAYPTCKIGVFGHSMGSYVARTFLQKYPSAVDAIIFSGTGYPEKGELLGARFIAKIESVFNKKDKPSKRLDKLSFGKFNAQIEHPQTTFDWLSRDPEVVKAYMDDPLCGQVHPTSFFIKFIDGLLDVLYMKKNQFSDHRIPILLVAGAKDPCGSLGLGVYKTADYYKNNSFEVDTLLYPEARHEVLNEINRHEVYQDVLEWLRSKMLTTDSL